MINEKKPKILVFSTDKISDPAIDMAGLLKKHYPPQVRVINVPCSSAIKPQWILFAFEKGFDGVFIAADGTDCPYSGNCTDLTANLVSTTHDLMKKKGMNPARLRMAAICSVCYDPFVRQMNNLYRDLLSQEN